jgi:MraZ protein
MANYIGEFDCKVDNKGRMILPAGLLKQFSAQEKAGFAINRSVFQKCLVLYTLDAYNEILNELNKLNKYRKENDDFIRRYTNGAVMVDMDSANRILFPKRLTEYAGIQNEVILNASLNKIEIWAADRFNDLMNNYDPESFADLAEKVMGSQGNNFPPLS